jgi:hypothetical protein
MDVKLNAIRVLIEGNGFGPPILGFQALLDVTFSFFEYSISMAVQEFSISRSSLQISGFVSSLQLLNHMQN